MTYSLYNVKCYNRDRVERLLGITTELEKLDFQKLLRENEVELFQPPYTKLTRGPTRRPFYYYLANPWLDNTIKQYNLIRILKEQHDFIVKPTYKQYEVKINNEDNLWNQKIFLPNTIVVK